MKLKKWCVLFSLLLVAGFAVSLISSSGGRTSSTGAASAADLNVNQANKFTCDGTGSWHFVNNKTDGPTEGTLTAMFSCGTMATDIVSQVNKGTTHWVITTHGDCTLLDAFTDLPGDLQLSELTCTLTPTPTPTSTPTPSPTSKPP